MTGWNMPPGCHPGWGPCQVCFKDVEHCICPTCEVCGEQGNPQCYIAEGMTGDSHLKLSKAQEISAQIHVVERDKWALAESESYLAVLYKEAAPYPFCRHPEKCYGKGYCPRDIACND